jgi:ketosteroid isomerase-like protein
MGQPGTAVAIDAARAGSFAGIDADNDVLAANRRYYQAFESADLDAMSEVWERSPRAQCTHPGWSTLRGWSKVAGSFFALFQGVDSLQFLLTEEHVETIGDTAWVTVDENLLGAQGGATVAALNLFVRDAQGRWRMVCHHGSVVAGQFEGDPDGPD